MKKLLIVLLTTLMCVGLFQAKSTKVVAEDTVSNKHKVTLHSNSEKDKTLYGYFATSNGNLDTVTVDTDDEGNLKQLENSQIPTISEDYSDYVFIGFYSYDNTLYYDPLGNVVVENPKLDSDLVLEARYEKKEVVKEAIDEAIKNEYDEQLTTLLNEEPKTSNETYTVILDPNGGKAGNVTQVEATYDSYLPELKTAGDLPTREGYEFLGFYDSQATMDGTRYYDSNGNPSYQWKKEEGGTIYAQWRKKVLTYNISDGKFYLADSTGLGDPIETPEGIEVDTSDSRHITMKNFNLNDAEYRGLSIVKNEDDTEIPKLLITLANETKNSINVMADGTHEATGIYSPEICIDFDGGGRLDINVDDKNASSASVIIGMDVFALNLKSGFSGDLYVTSGNVSYKDVSQSYGIITRNYSHAWVDAATEEVYIGTLKILGGKLTTKAANVAIYIGGSSMPKPSFEGRTIKGSADSWTPSEKFSWDENTGYFKNEKDNIAKALTFDQGYQILFVDEDGAVFETINCVLDETVEVPSIKETEFVNIQQSNKMALYWVNADKETDIKYPGDSITIDEDSPQTQTYVLKTSDDDFTLVYDADKTTFYKQDYNEDGTKKDPIKIMTPGNVTATASYLMLRGFNFVTKDVKVAFEITGSSKFPNFTICNMPIESGKSTGKSSSTIGVVNGDKNITSVTGIKLNSGLSEGTIQGLVLDDSNGTFTIYAKHSIAKEDGAEAIGVQAGAVNIGKSKLRKENGGLVDISAGDPKLEEDKSKNIGVVTGEFSTVEDDALKIDIKGTTFALTSEVTPKTFTDKTVYGGTSFTEKCTEEARAINDKELKVFYYVIGDVEEPVVAKRVTITAGSAAKVHIKYDVQENKLYEVKNGTETEFTSDLTKKYGMAVDGKTAGKINIYDAAEDITFTDSVGLEIVNGDAILNIDCGKRDFVVDNLDATVTKIYGIKSSGKVTFIGSGSLNIYVDYDSEILSEYKDAPLATGIEAASIVFPKGSTANSFTGSLRVSLGTLDSKNNEFDMIGINSTGGDANSLQINGGTVVINVSSIGEGLNLYSLLSKTAPDTTGNSVIGRAGSSKLDQDQEATLTQVKEKGTYEGLYYYSVVNDKKEEVPARILRFEKGVNANTLIYDVKTGKFYNNKVDTSAQIATPTGITIDESDKSKLTFNNFVLETQAVTAFKFINGDLTINLPEGTKSSITNNYVNNDGLVQNSYGIYSANNKLILTGSGSLTVSCQPEVDFTNAYGLYVSGLILRGDTTIPFTGTLDVKCATSSKTSGNSIGIKTTSYSPYALYVTGGKLAVAAPTVAAHMNSYPYIKDMRILGTNTISEQPVEKATVQESTRSGYVFTVGDNSIPRIEISEYENKTYITYTKELDVSGNPPEKVTVSKGDSHTVLGNVGNPELSKDGYTFIGWMLPNGEGGYYHVTAGDQIKVQEDMTLTAEFEENNYTLYYKEGYFYKQFADGTQEAIKTPEGIKVISNNQLEFTNFSFKSTQPIAMILDEPDLEITINGENLVESVYNGEEESTYGIGLQSNYSLTINGSGQLSVDGRDIGYYAYNISPEANDIELIIRDGIFTATASKDIEGSIGISTNKIIVNSNTGKIIAKGDKAIYTDSSITTIEGEDYTSQTFASKDYDAEEATFHNVNPSYDDSAHTFVVGTNKDVAKHIVIRSAVTYLVAANGTLYTDLNFNNPYYGNQDNWETDQDGNLVLYGGFEFDGTDSEMPALYIADPFMKIIVKPSKSGYDLPIIIKHSTNSDNLSTVFVSDGLEDTKLGRFIISAPESKSESPVKLIIESGAGEGAIGLACSGIDIQGGVNLVSVANGEDVFEGKRSAAAAFRIGEDDDRDFISVSNGATIDFNIKEDDGKEIYRVPVLSNSFNLSSIKEQYYDNNKILQTSYLKKNTDNTYTYYNETGNAEVDNVHISEVRNPEAKTYTLLFDYNSRGKLSVFAKYSDTYKEELTETEIRNLGIQYIDDDYKIYGFQKGENETIEFVSSADVAVEIGKNCDARFFFESPLRILSISERPATALLINNTMTIANGQESDSPSIIISSQSPTGSIGIKINNDDVTTNKDAHRGIIFRNTEGYSPTSIKIEGGSDITHVESNNTLISDVRAYDPSTYNELYMTSTDEGKRYYYDFIEGQFPDTVVLRNRDLGESSPYTLVYEANDTGGTFKAQYGYINNNDEEVILEEIPLTANDLYYTFGIEQGGTNSSYDFKLGIKENGLDEKYANVANNFISSYLNNSLLIKYKGTLSTNREVKIKVNKTNYAINNDYYKYDEEGNPIYGNGIVYENGDIKIMGTPSENDFSNDGILEISSIYNTLQNGIKCKNLTLDNSAIVDIKRGSKLGTPSEPILSINSSGEIKINEGTLYAYRTIDCNDLTINDGKVDAGEESPIEGTAINVANNLKIGNVNAVIEAWGTETGVKAKTLSFINGVESQNYGFFGITDFEEESYSRLEFDSTTGQFVQEVETKKVPAKIVYGTYNDMSLAFIPGWGVVWVDLEEYIDKGYLSEQPVELTDEEYKQYGLSLDETRTELTFNKTVYKTKAVCAFGIMSLDPRYTEAKIILSGQSELKSLYVPDIKDEASADPVKPNGGLDITQMLLLSGLAIKGVDVTFENSGSKSDKLITSGFGTGLFSMDSPVTIDGANIEATGLYDAYSTGAISGGGFICKNNGKITGRGATSGISEPILEDGTTPEFEGLVRGSADIDAVEPTGAVILYQAPEPFDMFKIYLADMQGTIAKTVVYESTVSSNAIQVLKTTGGNASVVGSVYSAKPGTEIELKATADSGYRFVKWSVKPTKGSETILVDKNNKFIMPSQDVTVQAIFIKEGQTYNIVVDKADFGTVTPHIESQVAGEEVIVTSNPNSGYKLRSLKITHADAEGKTEIADILYTSNSDGTISFKMPTTMATGDVIHLTPSFFKFKEGYSVNLVNTDGGTINEINKKVTADPTEKVELEATVDEAYEIKSWIVKDKTGRIINGISPAETTFGFEMPECDIYISAEFALKDGSEKNITIDETIEDGNIQCDRHTQAPGKTVNIMMVPDDGYIAKAVSVTYKSGSPEETHQIPINQTGDNAYSFTMPNADVTISAVFEVANKYKVDIKQAVGGKLSIEGNEMSFVPGTTVAIKVEFEDGFYAKGIEICDSTGTDIKDDLNFYYIPEMNVITFEMPNKNVTVVPTCYYEGSARAHVDVYYSPTCSPTLDTDWPEYGGSFVVTPNLKTGYVVTSIYAYINTEDGGEYYIEPIDNGDGTYKFNIPTYEEIPYTYIDLHVESGKYKGIVTKLSYVNDGNGWVYDTYRQIYYEPGEEVKLIIQPDSGKALETIKIVNAEGQTIPYVDEGDTFITFKMPESNTTVYTTFCDAKLARGVNIIKNKGGTVSTDYYNAEAGKTVTLTVTPDTGFVLDSLSVVNNEVKTNVPVTKVDDTTYTFVMPNSWVDIAGVFVKEDTENPYYNINFVGNVGGNALILDSDNRELIQARKDAKLVIYCVPLLGYEYVPDSIKVLDTEGTDISKSVKLAFVGVEQWVSVDTDFNKGQVTVYKFSIEMPNEEIVIVSKYKDPGGKKTVNIDAKIETEAGTVACDSYVNIGETSVFTIDLNSEYYLDSLLISDGKSVIPYTKINDTTYSFTLPSDYKPTGNNISIQVSATNETKYNIIVNNQATDNGKITVNGGLLRAKDGTVTFDIETDDYYIAAPTVMCGETEVEVTGEGPYTFTMPEGDVTISATYVDSRYRRVSVEEKQGGNISTVPLGAAKLGEEVKVIVSPNANYSLSSLVVYYETVDEYEVVEKHYIPINTIGNGNYSFTMPGSSELPELENVVHVAGTFEKANKNSISIVQPENGTIFVTDEDVTTYGDSMVTYGSAGSKIYLTNTPSENYKLKNYIVRNKNNINQTVDIQSEGEEGQKKYYFVMPAYPVTVTAAFEQDETEKAITIVQPSEEAGSIVCDRSSQLPGQQVKIYTVPSKGYSLSSLVIYETDTPAKVIDAYYNKADGSYTFTMPNAGVTVTASYGKAFEIRTVSSNGGVISTSNGVYSSLSGEKVTLKCVENDGYEFTGFTVVDAAGNPVTVTNNSFIMPSSYVIVSASYDAEDFTATIKEAEGAHGTISLVPSQAKYNAKEQIGIKVESADPGYALKDVLITTGDGKTVKYNTSLGGFEMPADDVEITPVFGVAKTYDISLAPYSNDDLDRGTVLIQGDLVSAAGGSTIQLLVEPNEGYELDYIEVYYYDEDNEGWRQLELTEEEETSLSFTMPSAKTRVVYSFTQKPYEITLGTMTGDTDGDVYLSDDGYENPLSTRQDEGVTYNVGEEVSIEVYPKSEEGKGKQYLVSSVQITYVDSIGETQRVDYTAYGESDYGGEYYSFIMPPGIVQISATFVEKKPEIYKITIDNNVTGATISLDNNKIRREAGDPVTLTATPDLGYKIAEEDPWTVKDKNGSTYTVEDGVFTMPESDVTVSVQTERISNTIEIGKGEGGTVEANKMTGEAGDTIILTVTPESGNRLKTLKVYYGDTENPTLIQIVKGTDTETGTTYAFKIPAVSDPTTIYVDYTFDQVPEYLIKFATTIENGNVVETNNQTKAASGDPVNLTVTPDIGYQLVPGSLTYARDGKTEAIEIENYQFTMPSEDITKEVTISAAFEPIDVNIKASEGLSHGSIEVVPESGLTFKYGTEATINLNPDNGYVVSSVYVAENVGGKEIRTNYVNDTKYTFKVPANAATVYATFVEGNKNKILVTNNTGGSISTNNDITIAAETEQVTVKLQLSPGYELDDKGLVYMNYATARESTIAKDVGSGEYTFTMPNSNVEVYAYYKKADLPITINKADHGTVTAYLKGTSQVSTAQIGDVVLISAKPDDGYILKKLTVTANGKKVPVTLVDDPVSGQSYTSFTMPGYAVTITPEFEIKQGSFVITGSGSYGKVVARDKATDTLITQSTLPEGKEIKIKVTPNDGYELLSISANGDNTLTQDPEDNTVYYATMPDDDLIITATWGALSKFYWGVDNEGTLHIGNETYEGKEGFPEGQYGSTTGGFSATNPAPWNQFGKNITSISIDSKLTLESTAYFFYGLSEVTSISGLSNFSNEYLKDVSYMFFNCGALEAIDLKGFSTAVVTNMSHLFSGCSSLTSLDLSGFSTGKVTDMSSMFEGCMKLASIKFSTRFNTSKVTNMSNMFKGLEEIKTLSLGSFDTRSLTNMSQMFASCSALETVYVKSSIWTTENVNDYEDVFTGTTSIVGGEGSDHVTYGNDENQLKYARVDGGTTAAGYFTEDGKHKLILNANETGVKIDKAIRSLAKDEVFGTLPSPTKEKAGYTFKWNTLSTGLGTDVDKDTKMGSEEQTIYAIWKANTYAVTLDQKEGTGGTTSVTATYDSTMPEITAPTKTGYSFAGYWDSETEETQEDTKYYDAEGKATEQVWDKTVDTTLYAHWSANNYTVNLDAQGGSSTQETVKAVYGEVLPNVEVPTKTGYTFDGYYDSATGTTQYIDKDGKGVKAWDQAGDTLTVYARWTPNEYTVTLNHQGGTSTKETVTATYDAAMPKIETTDLPTRDGYTFAGYWDSETSETADDTKYYYDNGNSAHKWDKDTDNPTLYAHWTANSANITYDMGMMETGGMVTGPLKAATGSSVELTIDPLPGYKLKDNTLVVTYGDPQETIHPTVSGNTATFTMPASDATVTAIFEVDTASEKAVNIDSSIENGKVETDKAATYVGDTVTLTVTPDSGYKLGTLKVTYTDELGTTKEVNIGHVLETDKYTFEMPGYEANVTATFIVTAKYSVDIMPLPGGTLTPDITSAAEGNTVTLTAVPDRGYILSGKPEVVKVEGEGEVTVSGTGPYTFTMPACKVEARATFIVDQSKKWKVDIKTVTGGTIAIAEPTGTEFPVDERIKLTITPNPGYVLREGSLKYSYNDGTSTVESIIPYYPMTGYGFIMPAYDTTVTCIFDPIPTHTITISTQGHGTISTTPTSSAYEGQEVKLNITPETGYKFDETTLKVTKTNGDLLDLYDDAFFMPTDNVTVSGTFVVDTDKSYSVTAPGTITGGSITVSPTSGNVETDITVTVTPDDGYKLTANSLKYTPSGGQETPIENNTFKLPAADTTVSGAFEVDQAQKFAVNIGTLQHGKIVSDPTSAYTGQEVGLTVTANKGYKLVDGSLTVTKSGGGTVTVSDNKFTMPNCAVTVTAQFEIDQNDKFNITVPTGVPHGVVQAASSAYIGETVTITTTPTTGYKLKTIKVTNDTTKEDVAVTEVTAGSSYTFVMPESNATISATFEVDQAQKFAVTIPESITGGSITANPTSAYIGQKVILSVNKNTGYKLKDGSLKVTNKDGGGEVTVTNNSFTMPETTQGVDVAAAFEKVSYSITVTQPTGGTISANKSSANYNDSIQLTIDSTTDGYQFKNWVVKYGAQSITPDADNKFNMPDSNVTVTAVFEKKTYDITYPAGGSVTGGTITTSPSSAKFGDEVTLQCTPTTGYKLSKWIVKDSGGNDVTVNNNKFTMPASAVTVTAEFAADDGQTFAITVEQPSAHGTISVKQSLSEAFMGQEIELSNTPATGYELDTYTAKATVGSQVVSLSGNKFNMPNYAVTVSATFKAKKYTVTLDANTGTAGTKTSVEATYDADMPTLQTTELPTKTGYSFAGYFDAASGGTQYYNADGTSTTTWDKDVSSPKLYAHWTPNEYAVTLNPNTGTAGSTTSVNATYDAAMPALTTAGQLPTKAGYTFTGFWDSQTTETAGTDTKYYNADGTSAHIWNKAGTDINIYAHWEANSYQVKFNANKPASASSSVTGTMSNQSFTYDETAKALTTNAYTLTGWKFSGWNTKEDGSGTNYSDGQSVQNLTTDKDGVVNLYAKWTPITYTVAYDANGGTGTAMTSSTFTYDSTDDKLTANTYTKTGYQFKGWAKLPTPTTPDYEDQQTSTKFNLTTTDGGTVTLYAVWGEKETKVTFDANGGTGGPAAKTIKYDADLPTLGTSVPTKTGYTFAGYFDNATEGQGTKYYESTGAPVTGKKWDKDVATATLYAQWTPITYSVKYDGNGATSGEMTNSTHTYDTAKNLTANAYSKTGYTFAGWSKTKGGSKDYDDQASVTNLTTTKDGTVTLYAVWTPINYSVKFNAEKPDSATGDITGSMDNEAFVYDTAKNLTANAYSLTGYTFDGWATTSKGTKVYADKASVKNLANTEGAIYNLYTTWKANEYTVTLNQNGATTSGQTSVKETYDATSKDITSLPSKTGYTFAGYYDTSATTGGNQIFTSTGAAVATKWTTASNITVYARWTPNEYKVTLNSNGGTGGTDSVQATYDADMPSATMPTKTGSAFAGYWDENATSGGNQYYKADGTSAKKWNKTSATILYARWTANKTTVTFNNDGGSGGPGTKTYSYGDNLSKISVPTKTGYTFAGYYDSDNKQYFNADGTAAVTTWDKVDTAVTLTAKWTAKTYVLPLNANGGTLGSTTQVTATYNADMPQITTGLPTKVGYKLTGLFDAKSGGTKYYNADGTSAKKWQIDGAKTLYAQWEIDQTQTFSVTMDSQIAHGTVTANPTSAYATQKVTLTINPEQYYELSSIVVEYGTEKITPKKVNDTTYEFNMPAAAVTVKAVFKGKQGELFVSRQTTTEKISKLYMTVKNSKTGSQKTTTVVEIKGNPSDAYIEIDSVSTAHGSTYIDVAKDASNKKITITANATTGLDNYETITINMISDTVTRATKQIQLLVYVTQEIEVSEEQVYQQGTSEIPKLGTDEEIGEFLDTTAPYTGGCKGENGACEVRLQTGEDEETKELLTYNDDYVATEGSVRINLTMDKLSTLAPGQYYLYVATKNAISKIPFKVVAGGGGGSDPSRKDESCEKVIGPTWHWNNAKGICEDTGVVHTYSR